MKECKPWQHNHLDANYDGRMEITESKSSYHRERCKICGVEIIQLYPSCSIEERVQRPPMGIGRKKVNGKYYV